MGLGKILWGFLFLIIIATQFAYGAEEERFRLTPTHLKELIYQDLKRLPKSRREYARYLSLANYHNELRHGGYVYSEADMATFRFGASKFVNSLSWNPEIIPLTKVEGSQGALLRLFIDDYEMKERLHPMFEEATSGPGLTDTDFGTIALFEPYRLEMSGRRGDQIIRMAGTQFVMMRADYFIASMTEPSYYRSMMGIGDQTVLTIEKALLGGKSAADRARFKQSPLLRAGFARSGVALHNRVIERHPVALYEDASLWLSYDFDTNIRKGNIFTNPIGPKKVVDGRYYGQHIFEHAAGEVILELPNHLQMYWLSAKGKFYPQDEAPTELVRDPTRGVIQSPLSCFECHSGGILRARDEVRPMVEKNKRKFNETERAFVDYAFPDPATNELRLAFDEDNLRYRQAIEQVQVPGDEDIPHSPFEPITRMYDLFEERPINLAIAIAELGLTEEYMLKKLSGRYVADYLPLELQNLAIPGGTVRREAFEDGYRSMRGYLRPERAKFGCPEFLLAAE